MRRVSSSFGMAVNTRGACCAATLPASRNATATTKMARLSIVPLLQVSARRRETSEQRGLTTDEDRWRDVGTQAGRWYTSGSIGVALASLLRQCQRQGYGPAWRKRAPN